MAPGTNKPKPQPVIRRDTLDPVVNVGQVPVLHPARPLLTNVSKPSSTSDLVGKLAQLGLSTGNSARPAVVRQRRAASSRGLNLLVNSVGNIDQNDLNLIAGTGITITDNGLQGVEFDVAPPPFGTGYFWGAQSFAPLAVDSGHEARALATDNQLIVVQLDLSIQYKISSMAMYCHTGLGTTAYGCAALYSIDGNTKIVDAGTNAFDLSMASQKYRNVVLSSPVTVPQGSYLFAVGATAQTGSVLCHADMGAFNSLINGIDFTAGQVLPTRFGTAANAISSGAMPATLGALTPLDLNTSFFTPAVMFKV